MPQKITNNISYDKFKKMYAACKAKYVFVYDEILGNDSVWFFFDYPKCYFQEFATVYNMPEKQNEAWQHIKRNQ